MISILIISDEITLSIKSCWKKFDPLLSKRNEEGNVQAGTHLIIIDDSPCHETIDKSNPIILNYYRQFLIKGFDRQDFSKSRSWNSDYQLFQVILPHIISQYTAKISDKYTYRTMNQIKLNQFKFLMAENPLIDISYVEWSIHYLILVYPYKGDQ